MTFYEHVAALREALGGRRFLLALGAGVVTSLLVMHGHIGESVYENLIIWTVGLFIAGNGAQRYIERRFGKADLQQSDT